MLAVRWYLRYRLSYGDLVELLAERGIDVARPCRHQVGDRWFVDETLVECEPAPPW